MRVILQLLFSLFFVVSYAQQIYIGAVLDYEDSGCSVKFRCQNGVLEITPYSNSVFQVSTVPNGEVPAPRPSISVVAQPKGDYSIKEEPDYYCIVTDEMQVNVDREHGLVSFLNSDGSLACNEQKSLINLPGDVTCSFGSMNDLAYYGGGYNGRHNQKGRMLVMNNTPHYGYDSHDYESLYICVPFLVSTSGYGIYFDDHVRGAEIMPYDNGISYVSTSPTPISYYFVGGGDMDKVMYNYTLLTGRQKLPPYWALGYITSRYGYRSEAECDDVISNLRKNDCPLDAIVLDLYWEGGPMKMGEMEWDLSVFPDPAKMLERYNDDGINTVIITEPFVSKDTKNYTVCRNAGLFANDNIQEMDWIGGGGLLDFTRKEPLDWMWQYYNRYTDMGISGWWLDLGEPEKDGGSIFAGGSIAQVHNEFGSLWVADVFNRLSENYPDMRHLLMPRSVTAGAQRYSVFPWTGDINRSWEGLQLQIPQLLSSGVSGFAYMGHDVGGFKATDGRIMPELYLRWVEMATFSTMLRTHSNGVAEPYLQIVDGKNIVMEPFARLVKYHYSFLPYTYSLCFENALYGRPLMRAVNYYDAQNPALANVNDEFMWGKNILVAPVVTPENHRTVIFPEVGAMWADMNDPAKKYVGGSSISIDVPLEVLPHYARVGSVLPRYTDVNYRSTKDIDCNSLSLTYYYDGDKTPSCQTDLYDDDHRSTTSIEDNAYQLTHITSQAVPGGFDITLESNGEMANAMQMSILVPDYKYEVKAITVNGTAIEDYTVLNNTLSIPFDWNTSSAATTISVRHNGSSAINDVEKDRKASQNIYNIAGQQVPDTYTGITIQNGKKELQR